ncbi:MAG TPA: HAD-IA family hydrolase [Actinomycetota bacterium]|nr:HAD-IA family hydrolase [Actinomycetota bacterium]
MAAAPIAVLLDLYDTLVESDWHVWHREMAGLLGVDGPVLRQAFDVTRPARSVGAYPDVEAEMRVIVQATGIDDPPDELVRDLAAREFAFMASRVRLHDDAIPTVRALRERGVRTALVSNCSHNTAPVVERLGLADELDVLILSFEVGARKPQREIYRAALDALGGVTPDDAVFVDDQVPYCDGAAALGIATRLIVRRESAPPLEGWAADANGHRVITDLRVLLDGS